MVVVVEDWGTGARSPSLLLLSTSRGSLSAASSSSPTSPHVAQKALPAWKTFRPGWKTAVSFSCPTISLPPGQEIYPEIRFM